MLSLWLLAHLSDCALEGFIGIGVDRKLHRLALADLSDVSLIDHDLDLQLGEILRDLEQHGGLEAGRDGLAGIDLAVDDHTLDGREDLCAAEIIAAGLKTGLGLFDPRALGGDLSAGEGDASL